MENNLKFKYKSVLLIVIFASPFVFGAFGYLNIEKNGDSTNIYADQIKEKETYNNKVETPNPSDSEAQLPEPTNDYDFYRNQLFDHFNLTYGDYLNMDAHDKGMFHNYTIALWGKENGTLTEEEAQQLMEHHSPTALGKYPKREAIIENTDGSFIVKFSITGKWAERVTKVTAYLDDDENIFFWGSNFKQMQIKEEITLFPEGHMEDNYKSWVGSIIWKEKAYFEIWCAPGYIDDCVEIFIVIEWDFYDVLHILDPWQHQDTKWERFSHTAYIPPVSEWPLFPTTDIDSIDDLIEWTPINIVDDDTVKPIVSSFIVDQEDLRYDGFNIDVLDPPTSIKEGKTYKYTNDQVLFILSEDDSPPGSLQMECYSVIDSYEQYIGTKEVELIETSVYLTLDLFGIPITTVSNAIGYGFSLADNTPGIKYKFVVQVSDSDDDRGEIDRETSNPLTFYLCSDASSTSSIDFGLIMGAGAGTAQLVQKLDGVIPDTDFSHVDFQTNDEYEVFPYKKDTTPTEMSFDIQYYNPFEFPIRIQLGYNQSENSPRLSTSIDIDQFKIVENGFEGRDNIYNGFGSGTPEEIESSVFNSYIPSEINSGGTGLGTLWFELEPKETKIFEDFLKIRVEDFELLSYLDLQTLMEEISMYIATANSLSSLAFDFMTYGIFDEGFQSSYSLDNTFNLYNALYLNPYLHSLKAVSNFGIKVENVYYPKVYLQDENVAIWNNTFCITDRETLNLFLIADEEQTLGYTFDSQTGYNRFRFAFYPPDEQVSAFATFIQQNLLRDTLLYISSFGSSLSDENPYKTLLEVIPMITAVGLSPLLYHFVEIMNGFNSLDYNFNEKPNPGLISVLIDQFPELLQDNELAIRTLSYLEKSSEMERELQGYYESMNRYHTAVIYSQWSSSSNQLFYAAEFSKNANQFMNEMTIDLAFILATISDGLSNIGMAPFSNENIDMVKNNFGYDTRYLTNTYDQSSFRSNDENTNYLAQTTHRFINNNAPSEISELGRAALNSISSYSSAKDTFKNLEKTCIHAAIDIQKNTLNFPIIDDTATQVLITLKKSELNNASILLDSGLYQLCIDTLEVFNDFVLDKYIETRNPEFSHLYYEGSRLGCLAQKWNQLDLGVFDYEAKEVVNGKSIEYIFQIHNDINYAMYRTKNLIVPIFNVTGLPPETNFRITYLNSTELPQTLDGHYYIPIGPEESILLKFVVEIPLNSPFELEMYNFEMLAFSEFIDKSTNYRQNFTLSILEDDLTPPEVTLSYNGDGYDSDPGILEFSVIEDGYGSEATGNLTIIGPDDFIYKQQFAEGMNMKDLSNLILSPGEYTATLFVENNDEDRGEIDEEIDQISISFAISDDDTDAPVLTLIHDGDGTDGSPGVLIFSITEEDSGSEATGYVTIEDPFGYIVSSEIYAEGTFTLDLNTFDPKLCELGFYTTTLHAKNNDEDGWEGDGESSSISIEFEITDDDIDGPVLTLIHDGDGTDGSPGTLTFSITEEDLGSEATGYLTIEGPNDFIYIEQFAEGTFILDLNMLDPKLCELGFCTATLYAENNDEDGWDGDEESTSISIEFEITDDDIDGPLLTLDHDGDGTDGSPGVLIFSITEEDSGSEATGYVTIEGPFEYFIIIEQFAEGTFTLDLNMLDPKICELGFYTATLYAENNDEDGWVGDEESTSISLEFEITDDDENPPVITITLGEINWYTSGDLVNFTFTVEAFDESDFSSININIGTYTADFLGYHEAILPEGFFDLNVIIWDNDNDRIIEDDKLSSTEILYNIILDLTPPVTEIIIDPFYDDGLGNIYVTLATQFTLEATDEVSGVAHTYYWIDDGPVNEDILTFSLTDLPDGIYRIHFQSIDEVGNEEDVKFIDVTLVSITVESYISNGVAADVINDFDVIFRKCKEDGVNGFMLIATNPGQVFYHIDITNYWPIPLDELTIYPNIPSDFVMKSSEPIHIYLDGVQITTSCIIVDGAIKILDVPSGSKVEIVIHLDYGLKGTFYEYLEAFWLRIYSFEPIVYGVGGDITGENNLLTGTYSSSTGFKVFEKKVTAIAGFIMDQNGNPIVNAMVELRQSDGTILVAFTDEDGLYFFIELTCGDYQIRVVYEDLISEWQLVIALKDEITWFDYIVTILIP